MTIAFFSNFINHHQKLVADEIYKRIGNDYTFVELAPMPDIFKENGYADYSHEPYVLRAWEKPEYQEQARILVKNVDVAFFDGAFTVDYELIRAKLHPEKLSFEVSERWLKKGIVNFLSPRLLKWLLAYHTIIKKTNTYKLCSSAFVPNDMKLMFAFENRCLKWGYFTKVGERFAVVGKTNRVATTGVTSFMWCARFLKWKHPELPIKMAASLKQNGYHFVLDMYGKGPELEKCKKMARELSVDDVVLFKGTLPNEDILRIMREHEIFLFTSDRNEGWGAVLNEAMSNGCAVVASSEIGAVPYLINDGVNGLVFQSKCLESLTKKVSTLLEDKQLRINLSISAQENMRSVWSPNKAVQNLFKCIDDLSSKKATSITTGPCSEAKPVIKIK